MTDVPPPGLPPAIAALHRAWNARDLNSVLACFQSDYNSRHPLHPERGEGCQAVLRQTWGTLLEAMPDFQAELLGWSVTGDVVWTEWRWTGNPASGGAFTAGGVMIVGLRDGLIAWARLYTETLTVAGPDWEAALREALDQAEPE